MDKKYIYETLVYVYGGIGVVWGKDGLTKQIENLLSIKKKKAWK